MTATLLVNFVIIWFMPKRFSRQEIYATWAVLAALTLNVDLIFGYLLDLYDFFHKDISMNDLIFEATLAPSYGVIFLNFMPKKLPQYLLYLIGWVLWALLYERLSILTGYISYKGWQTWYSLPIYIGIFLFLRWHDGFLRPAKLGK